MIEFNQVRDSIINVLPKSDHIDENFQTVVLGVIHDITTMVIDENVETIVDQLISLRVGLLQLLYLEKLHKEEAEKRGKIVHTLDGKDTICQDKIEFVQEKFFFNILLQIYYNF